LRKRGIQKINRESGTGRKGVGHEESEMGDGKTRKKRGQEWGDLTLEPKY